jgi:hypothetical protein
VPAGDVTVAFETPIDLVPGSQAKNFNDYHAHALLDVDATPYLGTDLPVPGASPAPAVEGIIHTGAKTVTFPNVAPGSHQVVVFLSFANHASLKPAISDAVTFTAE